MNPPKPNARRPRAASVRGKWLLAPVALAAVLLTAVLLAAWTVWRRPLPPAPDPTPDDPRLTFPTPYRNVRPEVGYVGDGACARCHADHARTYREHPMGRSLAPVAAARPVERYDEAARNPFDAQGFRYRVEPRDGKVWHTESGAGGVEARAEVHFAVGSGTRGRSYLVNRDGYLFQSPITWYPQKGLWDLSPRYERDNHHFARPITPECLFCHSNHADHVEHTVNRYRGPIFRGHAVGCERCHGPGQLHVRRHEARENPDGPDDTIVNPGRLEPALRDAVCQQCHLQGQVRVARRGRDPFDYRPGLPLHRFASVFLNAAARADTKFVGHVEQMHASACFRASAGKLGCVSCHDPHRQPAPEKKAAYYRGRCLECHAQKGCSLAAEERRRRSPDDSCVACHLPARDADVSHTAVSDHRIPRDPDRAAPPGRPPAGGIPLLPFHRDLEGPGDAEAARDLGVALMDRAERAPERLRRALGEAALPLLDAALARDGEDVPAWEARAHALWCQGRAQEAATDFDALLTKVPRREASLHAAATLAMEMNRPDRARTYWERALEVNPWRYEFHYGLAAALARQRDWRQAVAACQRALALNPAGLEARQVLVRCYAETGQKGRARDEFDVLMALGPSDPEALRRWFEQLP